MLHDVPYTHLGQKILFEIQDGGAKWTPNYEKKELIRISRYIISDLQYTAGY